MTALLIWSMFVTPIRDTVLYKNISFFLQVRTKCLLNTMARGWAKIYNHEVRVHTELIPMISKLISANAHFLKVNNLSVPSAYHPRWNFYCPLWSHQLYVLFFCRKTKRVITFTFKLKYIRQLHYWLHEFYSISKDAHYIIDALIFSVCFKNWSVEEVALHLRCTHCVGLTNYSQWKSSKTDK